MRELGELLSVYFSLLKPKGHFINFILRHGIYTDPLSCKGCMHFLSWLVFRVDASYIGTPKGY